MHAASLREAVTSPIIVIAVYERLTLLDEGRTRLGLASFHQGVTANYRIMRVLKGECKEECADRSIPVKYLFTDGSACLEPKGWKFDSSLLPAPESAWILFLSKGKGDTTWNTYRGNFGRVEATPANIERVMTVMQSTP